MSRLIFYTQQYPYGNGETFIENEIGFLAQRFDEVVIFPLKDSGQSKREVPSNCRVMRPVIKNNADIVWKGLFSLASPGYFIRHFFMEKAWRRAGTIKKYVAASLLCRAILSDPGFKSLNRNDPADIHYFYWGIGFAYALPFLKKAKRKIVRFHGTDLYLERRKNGYLPFRREIYANLTKAVYISKQGMNYALRHYPCIESKAMVSYLGTTDHGPADYHYERNIIRLVSCSHVVPLKRLELIVESLALMPSLAPDVRIQWTHIGDGPELAKIRKQAEALPCSVEVRFTGALPNEEVLALYRSTSFDVFVNVSSSEGLPVSIMEAISFGIPVVATDVGGTSEIVTPESGFLLPACFEPEILAEKMIEIHFNRNSYTPRIVWEEHFQAFRNYPAFIDKMLK